MAIKTSQSTILVAEGSQHKQNKFFLVHTDPKVNAARPIYRLYQMAYDIHVSSYLWSQ